MSSDQHLPRQICPTSSEAGPKTTWSGSRHAVFARTGDDLSMTLKIPLREALLGFERTIRHLDGHSVTIANAGEVPTPQPFYACCRAEIEQSLPVARPHAGPRRFRLWKFYLHTPREKTSL
mgnify:CR=1 FL=1